MEYKISELAQEAGVTKRTIHYYISKGLLMPPEGSGVNSLYNDSHLQRIRAIRKLKSEYLPLSRIREYFLDDKFRENYIFELPKKNDTKYMIVLQTNDKTEEKKDSPESENKIYVRENVCNVFEMHYTQENGEKYRHILDSVKNYVEKMLED